MDNQATLLNVETKELNPDWIDPNTPLKIPENPLHYKAHKLQLLLERLDKQATRNAAQFNSKNYIDALNEWSRVLELIKRGAKEDDQVVDTGRMVEERNSGSEETMGERNSVGLDSGISTDNPTAG